MTPAAPFSPARLALVGDRSPHVRAHHRIPVVLTALRRREGLELDPYWIPTQDVSRPDDLAGFDGIWIVPGSPYHSETGAVLAARAAREGRIPLLGTCGGFQHAVLEFARNVCGRADAAHAEYGPSAPAPVIVPLACSLAGHEGAVRVAPGSLAQALLSAERTVERYHCSYGLDPSYRDLLGRHGLRFTGTDPGGDVRVAELPGHPFYLLTLFQPELADGPRQPHPFIAGFARSVTAHAATRVRPGSAPVGTGPSAERG